MYQGRNMALKKKCMQNIVLISDPEQDQKGSTANLNNRKAKDHSEQETLQLLEYINDKELPSAQL